MTRSFRRKRKTGINRDDWTGTTNLLVGNTFDHDLSADIHHSNRVHASRLGPTARNHCSLKGYSEKNCTDARVTDNCQKKNYACGTQNSTRLPSDRDVGTYLSASLR